MKKIFIALLLCAVSMCTWAASFGQHGSTWTVGYSDDIDLYIDVKHKNDWNSLDLKWEGNFNVNHGTQKRIVIVGVITTDFLKKIVSNPDGAYGQCFAAAKSLDMSGATYDKPNDSEWTSLKSKLDGLWTGKFAYAHSENNVVTGKIYYPGDAMHHNKHITLSSSFEADDVLEIHPCPGNCPHSLTKILSDAGITSEKKFDLVKIVGLDNTKNDVTGGIGNINAFTLDLTGVTNLVDWIDVENQYISNIILPNTVKNPIYNENGLAIKDRLPLTSDVKDQFNLDKLYNVIVVENCVDCHEIHIDAYVNKPGFLATGLQYVPALEPSFYNNKYEPLWYNQNIENHNGIGYQYDTKAVTRLKLLGYVFARDLKSTDYANVDRDGHLVPLTLLTFQDAVQFKPGSCHSELAPSKKDPDRKGVHVNYCSGQGYSDKTFMSKEQNAGQVHTFDLTEAEFGYVDEKGKFQYYPADMTLSELQYFDSWRSVAHIQLPTSPTQYIIPEAFLWNSLYVREVCIPYNYTEIHRYAFSGLPIDTLRTADGTIYGYKGGISHFTTTAATNDDIKLLRQGDVIDYGDKTVTFPSTTEFVGRGAFAGYDGAALFEDVYCLAPEAPICEMFAFDQKTYVGDNYHHKGHLIKKGNYVTYNMAMLHFPNTMFADGRLNRIEMMKYSDMTRKYRLYDETGHYDNVGNILVWPTQQQYNRSFNQALAGVTWWAWNENIDGTDNPETAFSAVNVAGGGYGQANHEFMFPYSISCNDGKGISQEFSDKYSDYIKVSGSKGYDKTFWNNWDEKMIENGRANQQTDRPLTYDWVKYGGWHQFVLAELYDFMLDDPDPDKPKPDYFNFAKYNKNIWYTICFPFNLTKKQLLKAFGNEKEGEYPYLSTLASVVRDTNGPKIKVVMSGNLLKKKLVYEDEYPNTVKYKNFKPEYTKVEYGDDDIVIEANKPYFILPSLPEEEIAKAAFLGADYSRRGEITTVKMKEGDSPLFPVPTHVHAVNGTYSSFVDGQDKEVSDTTYAYNYYFVGNYIPQEMPENAYYLAPSKKSTGEDWSSFYVNTPKKNGVMWTENSCIVMAKVDDRNGNRGKGDLNPVEKTYGEQPQGQQSQGQQSQSFNYIWNANPINDGVFFAGTGHEVYAKSTFGMQLENNVTTSIQLPDDFVNSEDNKVYNLNGQFVGLKSDNMAKGIYIVGGKKIVVK